MILDTSVAIEKIRNNEDIYENITSITLIEYPPILYYEKFHGTVIFADENDQLLAAVLQEKLRRIGAPKSVGDLVIAAICINRAEELVTKDKGFIEIKKIEPRLRVIFLE